jgi:hypothetical protein
MSVAEYARLSTVGFAACHGVAEAVCRGLNITAVTCASFMLIAANRTEFPLSGILSISPGRESRLPSRPGRAHAPGAEQAGQGIV